MATSTVGTSLAVGVLVAFATLGAARAENPYERPPIANCSESPTVTLGSERWGDSSPGGSTGPTFPTACAPRIYQRSPGYPRLVRNPH